MVMNHIAVNGRDTLNPGERGGRGRVGLLMPCTNNLSVRRGHI